MESDEEEGEEGEEGDNGSPSPDWGTDEEEYMAVSPEELLEDSEEVTLEELKRIATEVLGHQGVKEDAGRA